MQFENIKDSLTEEQLITLAKVGYNFLKWKSISGDEEYD
jgi:hypothetical protein